MVHDNKFIDRYIELCDSRYTATVFVATLARQLNAKYDNVIDIAEALSWVLSGVVPENISNYKEIIKQREQRPLKYANQVLVSIIDKEVKEAVLESLLRSKRAGHLLYCWDEIYDEYRQTRVRVLTNKIWTELHENGDW